MCSPRRLKLKEEASEAFRAELQAIKFGARAMVPRRGLKLEPSTVGGLYELTLDDGAVLLGRVIATGARYRKLGVAEEERFQGAGLYYAATELEARAFKGQEVVVVVVGGGNSAGQAAMFLSSRASCVRLVCRGRDLSDSMSRYLIDRRLHTANVKIEMRSQVVISRITAKHTAHVASCSGDS